jgi:hypothetical protein
MLLASSYFSNNIERGLDEFLPLDGADICDLCQLDTTAGTKGTLEVSRRNSLLLDAGSAIDTASLRQTIGGAATDGALQMHHFASCGGPENCQTSC